MKELARFNKPHKKFPLTKKQLLGCVAIAAGFFLVLMEQEILGGVAFGVGATKIIENSIESCK